MLTFVPVKMEPRHCAIILCIDTLGDIVISIKATMRLPFPTLPKNKWPNSQFYITTETQILHLKAYAGETVKEELTHSLQWECITGQSAAGDLSVGHVWDWTETVNAD